ncbi:diaminopropionate ammonia-lyase [Sporosarcina sp. P13]|uniref:diaminopropionate ammonia-lyase n=1 Tax=Sporosarcina sp. P13 TaxID=2048263 RepID=UPI00130446B8|nr:diaminopropionate ammonia-lyase [Sporosarcina sp. P13]
MTVQVFNGCKVSSGKKQAIEKSNFLTVKKAEEIKDFFKTVEEYKETPLVSLDSLAEKLGVKKIYVKDESTRMGLNAFKVIGGLYGISKILCEKLNVELHEITFDYLLSEEVYEVIKDFVFISATDGNHGKGIAWMANKLGCKCVIYMPKNTVSSRVEAIESLGGTVHVTEMNYDDTMREVVKIAEENNWYHVQDQAWGEYTTIPNWISEGYMLIAHEANEQMIADETPAPTHIMLQAGAGSFAFGIAGYYADAYANNKPHMTILEPENAACYFESIQQDRYTTVSGELKTIMAGLSVGEPNTEAWTTLKAVTDAFVTLPDYVSARGMRVLASPLGTDQRVVSGESGSSIGIGLLSLVDTKEAAGLKETLQLDEHSVVLLFNTEGNTDPEGYENIVWGGCYPTPTMS